MTLRTGLRWTVCDLVQTGLCRTWSGRVSGNQIVAGFSHAKAHTSFLVLCETNLAIYASSACEIRLCFVGRSAMSACQNTVYSNVTDPWGIEFFQRKTAKFK